MKINNTLRYIIGVTLGLQISPIFYTRMSYYNIAIALLLLFIILKDNRYGDKV